MSTSHKTFREVKGLLDRLERSIDDARVRRLGGPELGPAADTARRDGSPNSRGADLDRVIGRSEDGSAPAASTPEPSRDPGVRPEEASVSEQTTPNRSRYGRAKPLPRPGEGAGPASAWRR